MVDVAKKLNQFFPLCCVMFHHIAQSGSSCVSANTAASGIGSNSPHAAIKAIVVDCTPAPRLIMFFTPSPFCGFVVIVGLERVIFRARRKNRPARARHFIKTEIKPANIGKGLAQSGITLANGEQHPGAA